MSQKCKHQTDCICPKCRDQECNLQGAIDALADKNLNWSLGEMEGMAYQLKWYMDHVNLNLTG